MTDNQFEQFLAVVIRRELSSLLDKVIDNGHHIYVPSILDLLDDVNMLRSLVNGHSHNENWEDHRLPADFHFEDKERIIREGKITIE